MALKKGTKKFLIGLFGLILLIGTVWFFLFKGVLKDKDGNTFKIGQKGTDGNGKVYVNGQDVQANAASMKLNSDGYVEITNAAGGRYIYANGAFRSF